MIFAGIHVERADLGAIEYSTRPRDRETGELEVTMERWVVDGERRFVVI